MLLKACKDIGLVLNTNKTKYMEIGRLPGKVANEYVTVDSNSYEKVKTFKYLVSLLTIQILKCRFKTEIHVFYFIFVRSKHICFLAFSRRI